MKTFISFVLVILIFTLRTQTQTLPSYFSVDFSKAGILDSMAYDTILATDIGFVGDSITNNDEAWNQAQAVLSESGKCLFFPEGNYVFSQTLSLPTLTALCGDGSDKTKLLFRFNTDYADLIKISGNIEPNITHLSASARKGTNVLSLSLNGISAGDWVYLNDMDSAKMFSVWAEGYSGQLLRVEEVWNDSIRIHQTLRRNYKLEDSPKIRKLMPKQHCGLACLSVLNQSPAVSLLRSNVYISYAVNCFVRGIESSYCDFGHISTEVAAHVDIYGNYFHDATAYGDGGQGYGINLQLGATDFLIQQNNFKQLRHSMLLQSGANGNVLRKNYSTQVFWDDFPTNAAGDLVMHGNFPYCNLMESNEVQNIVVDASHGINGHHNIFLRNRAAYYGIVTVNNPATDSTAYIGNEITSTLTFTGNFVINGAGNFLYGNNKQGVVTPSGTSDVSLVSLFDSTETLPIIGYPNTLNQQQLPIELLRENGQFTTCSGTEMVPVGMQTKEEVNYTIRVSPEKILFTSHTPLPALVLYDVSRRMIDKKTHLEAYQSYEFNVMPGIYLLGGTNLPFIKVHVPLH